MKGETNMNDKLIAAGIFFVLIMLAILTFFYLTNQKSCIEKAIAEHYTAPEIQIICSLK